MDRKDAITNTLLGIVALAGIPVMALGPELFPGAKALFFWAGLALIAGALVAILWTHRGPANSGAPGALAPAGNPLVFDAQLAEIREIEAFIGRKDEIELRRTFDFDRILSFNLDSCRADLSEEMREHLDPGFDMRGSRIDPKRMNVTFPDGGSIPRFDPLPGRVGAVHLSDKHIAACQRLRHHADSAQLPSDLIAALAAFADAVDDNVKLLMEVLDEAVQEDPANIVQHDRSGPYEGRVAHRYQSRFGNLKPLAAAVSGAIRRHLKVV